MVIGIARSLAISDDQASGKPWIVREVKIVDGIEFIPLRGSDRTFCKFGNDCGTDDLCATTDMRKLYSLSPAAVELVRSWQVARTDASIEHVARDSGNVTVMSMNACIPDREKKRARKSHRRSNADFLVDVNISDGNSADSSSMFVKMLGSTDAKACCWLEPTQSAIAFLKAALQRAGELTDYDAMGQTVFHEFGGSVRKTKVGQGKHDRWLATKGSKRPTKGNHKIFKIDELEAAKQWLHGEEGDGQLADDRPLDEVSGRSRDDLFEEGRAVDEEDRPLIEDRPLEGDAGPEGLGGA